MKVVERVGQWVAIILLLGYLGYLVALFGRQPPGPARQTAVLGFSAQQVSVYPRFVRGSVWWRVNSGYWHSTPWTQLSPTMPTPLRETLGWMQELHAGTWPRPAGSRVVGGLGWPCGCSAGVGGVSGTGQRGSCSSFEHSSDFAGESSLYRLWQIFCAVDRRAGTLASDCAKPCLPSALLGVATGTALA